MEALPSLTNYISNKVEFKLQIMKKEWTKCHEREERVELQEGELERSEGKVKRYSHVPPFVDLPRTFCGAPARVRHRNNAFCGAPCPVRHRM